MCVHVLLNVFLWRGGGGDFGGFCMFSFRNVYTIMILLCHLGVMEAAPPVYGVLVRDSMLAEVIDIHICCFSFFSSTNLLQLFILFTLEKLQRERASVSKDQSYSP